MNHPFLASRVAAVLFLASMATAGCTSMGDATLGNRPLIYKNAPADEVDIKAGVVRKHNPDEDRPAERPAKAARSEPRPARESAPAPSVARAAPAEKRAYAGDEKDFINRYTQASRYGDLLFVSGQIAIDPRTGAFNAAQDVEAQTRQTLENIQAILEANRLTMANVVSTTVYVSSISRIGAMDAVYHDFFKGTPPARTVVEVSNLPRGALVEISVVAGR